MNLPHLQKHETGILAEGSLRYDQVEPIRFLPEDSPVTRSKPVIVLASTLLMLMATAACAQMVAEKTEPKNEATVDRPVRSLRVWFDHPPDVEKSKLTLVGPDGDLEVVGIHTMGDDDLMARVTGAMPDGEYTATWESTGDDGQPSTGSWTFTIQRKR